MLKIFRQDFVITLRVLAGGALFGSNAILYDISAIDTVPLDGTLLFKYFSIRNVGDQFPVS